MLGTQFTRESGPTGFIPTFVLIQCEMLQVGGLDSSRHGFRAGVMLSESAMLRDRAAFSDAVDTWDGE